MCELLERERREGMEEGRREGLKEGRKEGRREGLCEGQRVGNLLHLISLTLKKRDRGMAVEDIADALEEEAEMIERILLAAAEAGSDELEEIYAHL